MQDLAHHVRIRLSTAEVVDGRALAQWMDDAIGTGRRAHIVKLGLIRRPIGEPNLKELRNHHLVALQLASDRYDFGEEMP